MAKPLSDRAVTIYCGLLMAITAFSIDITLPFFSQIRDTMQTTNEAVYATITLNIFFLGLGQLLFGSLSDRYGRRPAVALGLSIYLLGTVCAILAADIDQLLAGRALQGLGAGAAPVVARAIIRDRFSGKKMAQNMALAAGIFSIGPIAAPLIGAALVEAGGNWRVIFIAMAVLATALMLGLLRLPETLAKRRLDALQRRAIAANLRAIFTQPQSRYFLLLSGWAMVSIVMIITGAAPVMENAFGVTGTWFAILFAAHGVGIIIGQFCNHWLIGRYGTLSASICGAVVMSAAFAVTVLLTSLGIINAVGLAALIIVFAIGYLPVYSNAASLTLEHHGDIAGFTAAFYGAYGQLFSAVIASILVAATGGQLLGWSMALAIVCTITLFGLLVWQRRLVPANGTVDPA